ncbi:MAG: carboxylesterase family protein [Gammaproteobacteria bacterium]|nr:carboxylesterase family protein [Gammaproteobacteria bacterium]
MFAKTRKVVRGCALFLRHFRRVLLGVGGLVVSFSAVAFAESKPSLLVNGETLIGAHSAAPGVDAFLGVPFAVAPIGELRWQAPREFHGHGGTRPADRFAPACMQSTRILDWYRGMAERFGGSRRVFADLDTAEDCLYLNIWAPTKPAESSTSSGLPVMVFVHGGSNRSGWSFEPNYHGHRLAAEGVVVVSIAYRLGVFGFFAHPQLAGANFGLQDQLAALRWIQRNIANFGGDPRRVTMFGESSGAGNIAALMLSPASRGLLQRAILQSGSAFGWPKIRTLADEQARGLELARALDGRQSPKIVDPSRMAALPQISALRRIDAKTLLRVAEEVYRDHYHAPVIDGEIITAGLDEQLARADWPLQQLMIGSNANEYYSATAGAGDPAAVDRAVAGAEILNTAKVREILSATPDVALALDRLATAESMLCPAQWLAAGVARAGRPVWMYQFARVREGAVAAQLRAYHGAELPYVFGTHDAWLPTADADRQLTQRMMAAWVEFARSGSPLAATPHWPRFTAPGPRTVMQWNAPLDEAAAIIDSPEPDLCRIYGEKIRP